MTASTLGNDVVDLRDPESDPATLHPRFDSRVFCEEEREWIRAGTGSTRRWQLWAAKEAAYKAGRKRDPELVFSPIRIQVSLDEEGGGAARCGELSFSLRVREDGRCVHALALHAPKGGACFDAVIAAEGPVTGGDASRSVRELARCQLVRQLDLDVAAEDLEFRRGGRIPRLWIAGAPAAIEISLSHHGSLVGFAAFAASEPVG